MNRKNIELKEHLYKRRQTIVDHPFGTIKRQWGFSYILTKRGINRATSDVGFMFIAYNFRRILNILGHDRMKEYLRILATLFFGIFCTFKTKFSHFQTTVCMLSNWIGFYRLSLKLALMQYKIAYPKRF
jgi:hypothetical protein